METITELRTGSASIANGAAPSAGDSAPTLVLIEGSAAVCLAGVGGAGGGTRRTASWWAEWMAGRTAVKRAAARESGTSPGSVTLSATAAGAPRAWIERGPAAPPEPGPRVSLSHRDGCVAAIADRRRRVGVDLERLVTLREECARYFLTENERKRSVPDRVTLWALKEAAWKALECDESTPFTALELHFDDEGALRAVSLERVRLAAGASVLSPWPGYVLAVVWLEEDAE